MNKKIGKLTTDAPKSSRIFDQLIGAVITLIVVSALTYGYHIVKELNKGKLRIDYPLLVYKCEYFIEYPLGKMDPQWFYILSFANLTRNVVNNIDISIKFGLKCSVIMVRPMNLQFYAEPLKALPGDTISILGTNTDHIKLLGKDLSSGRSASCLIVISSKERPSLSDFEINITCPSGTFEKVTSTQWEKIGWQKAVK
jgi:hypothetical protein